MSVRPAPPFDVWAWTQCQAETWSAALDPAGRGRQLAALRLERLIAAAQAGSPLYRRHASGARALADFEPVSKKLLMAQFDDWATDRRITRGAVDAFVADPAAIADGWLGRYLVWTSSGTSGEPGVFVQDGASLAAYDAIDSLRLRAVGRNPVPLGAWGMGRCFAFLGATGGHFAGHVSMERLRRLAPPPWAPRVELLSVLEPLRELAARLQALQPDVLITYPSAASALARLQAAGTLTLKLRELWLGGEQLSAAQRELVRGAFGCPVRNSYGASEFFSMAFECSEGRLHLNDDWVILEPVDRHLRPVAPGEESHTTLLTNLANRTQPLLRYELADRVRFTCEACSCGNAFPVIEVQGRADHTLELPGRDGRAVTILPLALETAIEEEAGVTLFQVLDRGAAGIELRFEAGVADPRAAFAACRKVMLAFFARHGALPVRISQGKAPPRQQARSGKVRRVLVDAGD
ncbi:Coenzyme F390 synthetase-like protein [Rubrivivax sp. A210]|uniref:phenylacetate--CoA ligase family protein n=1 Tax=Rubrivivax sp. A210 TaxID=2772301 RepID=UPI00191843F3|nr:phenylacetate--CoA ligase family protein [Rubrivivax sp. A210]CAD5375068.1 Coenzyme F390 synthetase-like protein [Rubrivivax sp. A210]